MSNVNLTRLADVLEKSAEYISELETKVASYETKIREMETQIEKSASEKDAGLISSLREKGYGDEDIANLRTLPRPTLEKLASADDKVWDMGAGHTKAASNVDPIMAFILS